MKKKNTQRYGEHISLSQALKIFIEGSPNLKRGLTLIKAKEAWLKIIGNSSNIINSTNNIFLKKDKLYISISSAPLRHELHLGKEKLTKLINEELGEQLISDIVFR